MPQQNQILVVMMLLAGLPESRENIKEVREKMKKNGYQEA